MDRHRARFDVTQFSAVAVCSCGHRSCGSTRAEVESAQAGHASTARAAAQSANAGKVRAAW